MRLSSLPSYSYCCSCKFNLQSQSAIDEQSASALDKGTVNRAFLSLQRFSAIFLCIYAHKDATYNLPLEYVQKALAARCLDRLSCLTPLIREDTGDGRGFCAQLLRPSALRSCRHRVHAAFFQLFQRGADLRFGMTAVAPCPCTPCAQAEAGAAPVHRAPSEAKDRVQAFAGHVSSPFLVSVLEYQLLIQLSLPSNCHFQPHSCKDAS